MFVFPEGRLICENELIGILASICYEVNAFELVRFDHVTLSRK